MKQLRTATDPKDLLFKRLDDFFKEKNGVIRGKDIEYLHRMRVASRRLRTALWAFKSFLADNTYRNLTNIVKAVTSGLGQARDLDTHIAFLKELSGKDLPDADYLPGIRALTNTLCVERNRMQSSISLLLQEFGWRDMKNQMEEALKELPVEHKHDKIRLKHLARKKIGKKLDDFLRVVPPSFSWKKTKELHQLRIKAKHLRYALESFNPLYDCALDMYIEAAHAIQDDLGDFHNYDVWLGLTRRFARGHAHDEKLICGVRFVEEECVRRRDEALRSFIQLWDELLSKRKWEKLRGLL
jgi:CHAD domain-containing protein